MTSSNLTIIFSNTFSARVVQPSTGFDPSFFMGRIIPASSSPVKVAPGKRRGTVRFVGRYLTKTPGWCCDDREVVGIFVGGKECGARVGLR